MSRAVRGRSVHEDGFPRVSGDEPPTFATVLDNQLFSPRERG